MPSFGQSTPAFSSPFDASSASAFRSSSTVSLFGVSSTPAFSTSRTPLFASSSTPSFGFSSAAAVATPMFNTALSFDNTESTGPFLSSSAIDTSLFRQPNSLFGKSQTSASSSLFGGQSAAGFDRQSTGFAEQSTKFGGSLFAASPSLTPFSTQIGLAQPFSNPSQPLTCAPTSRGFSCGNFGQTQPAGFGGSSNIFSQNLTPPQSTGFAEQSTKFGGSLFAASPSLTPSSTQIGLAQPFSNPSQPSTRAPTSRGFSCGNFGQTQPAGFGGSSNIFSQNLTPPANQPNIVYAPAPLVNPFGTLPPAPQLSISRSGGSSSNLYGIRNMPVSHKRVSSLVTPMHFSHKRIRLPPRRYPPKSSSPRVPFFLSEEEVPTTPKADGLFIRRENPRALDILPIEQWPPRLTIEGALKIYNEKVLRSQDGVHHPSTTLKVTQVHADHQTEKVVDFEHGEAAAAIAYENGAGEAAAAAAFASEDGAGETAAIVSEHGAGETAAAAIVSEFGAGETAAAAAIVSEFGAGETAAAAIVSEFGAGETAAAAAIVSEFGAGEAAAAIISKHGETDDIEALMPKLRHPEYYTEPRVEELAAKERATPGFCGHVKDFIVGRHGYGSIKFEGETDVRRLDLEALVQFNHREVIVYKDASKKPPLGQGLNKPGEVTLLNVKHVDRNTGHHFTEGPKIESYCKMLKKKAEEQGAKYVSYEPVKGEWKFKVDHF